MVRLGSIQLTDLNLFLRDLYSSFRFSVMAWWTGLDGRGSLFLSLLYRWWIGLLVVIVLHYLFGCYLVQRNDSSTDLTIDETGSVCNLAANLSWRIRAWNFKDGMSANTIGTIVGDCFDALRLRAILTHPFWASFSLPKWFGVKRAITRSYSMTGRIKVRWDRNAVHNPTLYRWIPNCCSSAIFPVALDDRWLTSWSRAMPVLVKGNPRY